MILWNLKFEEWLKLWKNYKVKPYDMTEDAEFVECIIRSCETDEELFHKFQWELIENNDEKPIK